MKKWLWLIPVYLIALVAYIPAAVVHWFPMPAGIYIEQVSGTLWQGRVGYAVINQTAFQNVSWSLSPSQLITGQLGFSLTVPSQGNPLAAQASGSASVNSIKLANLRATGELAPLMQLVNFNMPLKTEGQWRIALENYTLDDLSGAHACTSLEGNAAGSNIRVLVNHRWEQLGDFPLNLGCAQSGAVALSMAGENSLGLNFEGTVSPNSIRVNGTVQPNPRTPEGLAKMLSYLGRPDNQGRYRFSI
tara:strand:- start:764 stop:1501 length:738 start_codon:yes stop_codon:yes gene_type:complete